eukprot:467943-Rhodomonas_salina.1
MSSTDVVHGATIPLRAACTNVAYGAATCLRALFVLTWRMVLPGGDAHVGGCELGSSTEERCHTGWSTICYAYDHTHANTGIRYRHENASTGMCPYAAPKDFYATYARVSTGRLAPYPRVMAVLTRGYGARRTGASP